MYLCQIKMDRYKDAEMTLRNIIEGVQTNLKGLNPEGLTSNDLLSAKLDFLVHVLNYLEKESGVDRLLKLIDGLLKSSELTLA